MTAAREASTMVRIGQVRVRGERTEIAAANAAANLLTYLDTMRAHTSARTECIFESSLPRL